MAEGRKSNFELLRIIAMMMIVSGHMYAQAFDLSMINIAGNSFMIIFCSAARIAVNLFLMTGIWFMVDSKFRVSQIIKLYSALWFYSVGITIILLLFRVQVGMKNILSCFFPFIRRWMWFVPAYLSLLLLSPFLKTICDRMAEKEMRGITLVGAFLIVFMSTVSEMMDTFFCALTWFVYCYFLIKYYKKYLYQKIKCENICLFTSILLYIVLVSIRLISYFGEGPIYHLLGKISTQYLMDYKSIPNVLCSIGIFIFFSKLEIGSRRCINEVARNTLDIYMIHQCPTLIPILWTDIFKSRVWERSGNFIFIFIFVLIMVYLLGSVIGRIRTKLLEPAWIRSNLYQYLCLKLENLYRRMI